MLTLRQRMALGSLLGTFLIVGADREGSPASLPRSAPLNAPAAPREYEYVGTKRCRMCHTPWYESWQKTSKSRAFESLRDGASPEAKRLAGLDVDTDYTRDGRCLPCHTVSFDEPGGYVVPDHGDDHARRQASEREGVGCEACHGPGSGFVPFMREVALSRKPYRLPDVLALGRRVVTVETCLRCHHDAAPCRPADGAPDDSGPERTFRPDLNDPRGFHERFPLELRESSVPEDANQADDLPNATR